MNNYEQKLADAMQLQFGDGWYLHGAHPQAVADYMRATNDATRADVIQQMQRDAIGHATRVIQAGLHAGVVNLP